MPNNYFVCSRNRPPVAFDIAEDRPVADAEIVYFIRIFRLLEQRHSLNGYTVCFAWSSWTRLPRLGMDVIAVIYGDEHCRIPAYASAVGAVIKCHGLFPTFVPRRRPLRLAQIEMAEFLRNLVLWLPTGWRWAISRSVRARCHLVPIGYGIPTNVEPLPFDQRPYVTSFLGSIPQSGATSGLRRLIGTPKAYCRAAMMRVLKGLQPRDGADAIRLSLTGGFQESLKDAGETYSNVMARTQLCVAPRGTTHETWRICDGLKFGCVVIADRLPRHKFYSNSPVLEIEDWRDLPALIDALLADRARMRELHEKSLHYWNEVLSEPAQAERCAHALGLAPHACAA